MTVAELVKRSDYQAHKQSAFLILKKYYQNIDNVEYWYDKYLLALYQKALYPSFNSLDMVNNKRLFSNYVTGSITEKVNAEYFIDKLFTEYDNGNINKMIYNPARYADEVTKTETGKTTADLIFDATKKTAEQAQAAGQAVAETTGDLLSTIKNLLPVILIALIFLYFQQKGK